MDSLLSLFTAFGLSSSAGLNAYLPLLVVALLARYTDLITLEPPWNTMENGWVIGALAVLLLIEILVDKIPAVDTVNDTIQTAIRPVAGAILFAAGAGVIGETHPVLTMIAGLLVAGSVHTVKATARPLITATTAGVANPVVSAGEDILSFVIAVLSILLPIFGLLVLVAFAAWLIRRRRRTFDNW